MVGGQNEGEADMVGGLCGEGRRGQGRDGYEDFEDGQFEWDGASYEAASNGWGRGDFERAVTCDCCDSCR